MNILQKSVTIVSKASGLIRDWFNTKSYKLIHPNASEQKGEVDENQRPTHPVWDGSLDEPIWW